MSSTTTTTSNKDPTQVLTEATHVCYQVLFDRSGSMSSMPGAPAALEEFVGQQREFAVQKNLVTDFTLTTFETHAKQISNFTHIDLKTQTDPIPPHQLSPSGATRLIDTALEQINCLRDTLKLENQKATTAPTPLSPPSPPAHWVGIFVLFTDGMDNQSLHTAGELKREIQKLTTEGVHCYFLGANQDAIQTGEGYGFRADQSLTYSGDAANEALGSASQNIMQGLATPVLSGQSSQPGFTPLQREISSGTPSQPHKKTKIAHQHLGTPYSPPLSSSMAEPSIAPSSPPSQPSLFKS